MELTEENILSFIQKSKNSTATTKQINAHFLGTFSIGQISGLLFRLRNKGTIVQTERGVYSIPLTNTPLDNLKSNLKQLLLKQNNQFKITDIMSMNPDDQSSYYKIINFIIDSLGKDNDL